MNIQALIYGFIGISGFTLVAIGAFNNTPEMWEAGIALLTYLLGVYTDSTVKTLKNKLKKKNDDG
jgi:uncharacterized membrane protein YiaA